MAKAINIKPKKERAENYENKVKFDGTLEDMINISLTGAGVKKNIKNKPKSSSSSSIG